MKARWSTKQHRTLCEREAAASAESESCWPAVSLGYANSDPDCRTGLLIRPFRLPPINNALHSRTLTSFLLRSSISVVGGRYSAPRLASCWWPALFAFLSNKFLSTLLIQHCLAIRSICQAIVKPPSSIYKSPPSIYKSSSSIYKSQTFSRTLHLEHSGSTNSGVRVLYTFREATN